MKNESDKLPSINVTKSDSILFQPYSIILNVPKITLENCIHIRNFYCNSYST